jgi:hypothetical protein
MDILADNHDADAAVDDGTCRYTCTTLAAHYRLSFGFSCVVATDSVVTVDYLPVSLGSRVVSKINRRNFMVTCEND